MRAHEFITEDEKRRPEISLRHLNHLKHINRARAASLARQAALKRVMYANPAREHERIELEKARLESRRCWTRTAGFPTGKTGSILKPKPRLSNTPLNARPIVPHPVSWTQFSASIWAGKPVQKVGLENRYS